MRRKDVVDIHVVGRVRRNVVRELGIGIGVGEQERKARKARGEFVDYSRRDDTTPGEGVIRCRTIDFASWWESRENGRTAVQEVALELLFSRPHDAEEDIVVLIEHVVDSQQVARSADRGGRIPEVSGLIQS